MEEVVDGHAHHATANETGDSDELSSPVVLSATASIHLVTFFYLAALCRLVHRRVQTGHPVYAVVLQDVALLTATNALCLAAFPVFALAGVISFYEDSTLFVISFAMHFHQVSWLVITLLRYYLVRHADEDLPELSTLLRPAVALVWICSFVLAVVFFALRPLNLWLLDTWTEFHHFIPRTQDVFLRWGLAFMALVVINIPDFVSVVVYVFFYRHSIQQAEPQDAGDDHGSGGGDDDGEYFGGIFVGGGEDQFGQVNPAVIPQDLPGQVPLEDERGPAIVALLPAGALPMQQQQQVDEEDGPSEETKCATQALKIHAMTCLFDFVVFPPLLSLAADVGSAGGLVCLHLLLVGHAYWISTACVLRNFGKLRMVVRESLEDLFCCY